MSGIAHLLADFAPLSSAVALPGGTTESLREDERLEAFERGYKEGWDDSARAHGDEQAAIGSALARNLEDLSFTQHEAREAVLAGLKPLFESLVASFLPALAQQAIGAQIAEQLSDLAKAEPAAPVELAVAPDVAARVSTVVADAAQEITVVEDSTLSDMQAYLRAGSAEREVDLSKVMQGAVDALSSFYDQPQSEERLHG